MIHLFNASFYQSRLQQLACVHPYLCCVLVFLGIPMGILLGVFLIAYIATLPFALFMNI